MNIIKEWPIRVDDWFHAPQEQFLGRPFAFPDRPVYLLGMSPQDPEKPGHNYCNIGVEVKSTFKNGEKAFFALTSKTALVRLDGQTPTVEEFFDFLQSTFKEFEAIYNHRIKQTNLVSHKLASPNLDLLRPDIQSMLDTWDRTIKHTSLN